MTVYFYGRNSDLESFDKKSSIETQLSKCKSYANIKDLKIDVEVFEQVSGTVPCEKEHQVIRQMLLMRKQGKSYRDISSKISKSTRKLFPVSWS